jgi:hypothetical protein
MRRASFLNIFNLRTCCQECAVCLPVGAKVSKTELSVGAAFLQIPQMTSKAEYTRMAQAGPHQKGSSGVQPLGRQQTALGTVRKSAMTNPRSRGSNASDDPLTCRTTTLLEPGWPRSFSCRQAESAALPLKRTIILRDNSPLTQIPLKKLKAVSARCRPMPFSSLAALTEPCLPCTSLDGMSVSCLMVPFSSRAIRYLT